MRRAILTATLVAFAVVSGAGFDALGQRGEAGTFGMVATVPGVDFHLFDFPDGTLLCPPTYFC